MKDISRSLLNLIFCIPIVSFGQELSNFSNGELIELAADAELYRDYRSAAEYYEAYLEKKPSKINYRYKLAESYRSSNQYKKAIEQYQNVLASKSAKKYPLSKFHLANMEIANGNCDEATTLLEQFRKEYRGEKNDRRYRRLAKFSIEGCQGKDHKGRDFIIEPLPAEINKSHMEGSPTFIDEKTILYNSLKLNSNDKFEITDALNKKRKFYSAVIEEDEWVSKGEWINEELETNNLEIGNGSFSLDGNRFYYSLCFQDQNANVNCDIFIISKVGEKWTEPQKLPEEISSKRYTETQVAVGLDEKNREVIYFVSNRPEGKGGLDIWYTVYDFKKNEYKSPRNCGSKINSVGDEMTPFINPSNRKLYFSSNGHPGYGQLDVFSSLGLRSKWEEPKNLGSTINSSADELYYVLAPKGNAGIFASNRFYQKKASTCCDDLFYFIDPDFVSVSYKAKVQDEENNKMIGAEYQLFQKTDSTDEKFLIKSGTTNEEGEIDFELEPNQDYSVVVKKEDYYTLEKEIQSPNTTSNTVIEGEVKMKRITKEAVQIENIYYEFDKSDLTKEAKESIKNTILEILEVNPQLIVEIGSHTDGNGTEAYNKNLSQARAESVVKYLISEGIPKENLVAKGYGESLPIQPNKNEDGSDNPEGRAKNRRTEFRVVGSIKYLENDDDY